MGVAANIGNIAIGFAIGFAICFGCRIIIAISLIIICRGLRAVFGGLRFQQFLAVTDRNLIIVRMNFVKRQKAVAIAAIFHKGRL